MGRWKEMNRSCKDGRRVGWMKAWGDGWRGRSLVTVSEGRWDDRQDPVPISSAGG